MSKAAYSKKGPLCRGCSRRMMANSQGYECMNVLCDKKHVATFLRKGSRATRQFPLSGLSAHAGSVARYALYGAEIDDPLLAAGVEYGIPIARKYGVPLAKSGAALAGRGAKSAFRFAKQKFQRAPAKTLGMMSAGDAHTLVLIALIKFDANMKRGNCTQAFDNILEAVGHHRVASEAFYDKTAPDPWEMHGHRLYKAERAFEKSCLRKPRSK